MHYYFLRFNKKRSKPIKSSTRSEMLYLLKILNASRLITTDWSPYTYVWSIKKQKNRSYINLFFSCKRNVRWSKLKYTHKNQPSKSDNWRMNLWKRFKFLAQKTLSLKKKTFNWSNSKYNYKKDAKSWKINL